MVGTSVYHLGNSKNLKSIFNKSKYKSPNLVVSSPPYYDILNYNNNAEQIGYGQEKYTEYLDDVCQIFQDCYDLATPNASFWLIVDTFKKDGVLKTLPFDIVTNLLSKNANTWRLKEVIIWDKEKNIPWNGNGHFKNQFEYILFFTKGDDFYFSMDEVREITDLKKWWKSYPERYNSNGKAPSNVWSITNPIRGWGNNKQEHFCPFPYSLVEKIISISSKENDLILDPFAGSGTLLAIASLMNRKAIGVDINTAYKKLYEEKIILGAKEYWDKKESDNKNNDVYYKDFFTTNKILRIHKVAGFVVEDIAKANDNLIFSCIINPISIDNSNFVIYILTNNPSLVTIPNLSTATSDLIKQAKYTPTVIAITSEILIKEADIKDALLYKFTKKRIYSYQKSIKYKSLIKKNINDSDIGFYSFFSLKLK